MLNTKLYFAGSAKLIVDGWLQDKKYPRLMSQLNDRGLIPKWEKYQKEVNPDAFIFIDSGAYSAYTKGATIDVEAYLDWLNAHGDAFTVFAQVDFIPGKSNLETDPDIYLKAPGISWENYLYMRSKLRPELRSKLLYVYHQGEDFKWLQQALDWRDPDTGEKIDYIGISPHTEVTSANRLNFCKKMMNIIKKSTNPEVKYHLFGMTALQLLQYVPATSVDSTTWLQSAIHGQILVHKNGKLAPVVVSERTLHLDNHFIYLAPDVQKEIAAQIKELGWDPEPLYELTKYALPKSQRVHAEASTTEEADDGQETLASSISERQMFNAASMQHYLKTTDYIGFPKSARRIGG